MGIISWLIVLILGAVVAALGVANRGDVTISLDPVPFQLDLPIALVVGGAILLGFFWGYFTSWFGGAKFRRAARIRAHTIEITERELKTAKDRLTRANQRVADLEKQLSEKSDDAAALPKPGAAPALPKPTKAA